MIKLKKNVLVETHKKNLASRYNCYIGHPTDNFKNKTDLPVEKVGKITYGTLTKHPHCSNRANENRFCGQVIHSRSNLET